MISKSIALGKKPHIVVLTPGRFLDHCINTKGFSIRHSKHVFLYEPDRLLDLDLGAHVADAKRRDPSCRNRVSLQYACVGL